MPLVVLATDRLTLRNVRRLAAQTGLDLVEAASLDELDGREPPTALVIDLEMDDAIATVERSKQQWPQAMVVGVVTIPGGTVWKRAELAGCDLVTTRGAMAKAVPKRLAAWMEAPGGRRLRLFAMDDVAGRLGVVERLDDPEVGPLAVYHIGGEICVVQDICPHAGARLSHGEVNVDEGIVTCPEHGSRFDTCTGERVRGPSDDGLRTFRVVIEDGQAYVQLDQA
jgi:nitrite reductase/ring-hydroxylating ferredoxin subunit